MRTPRLKLTLDSNSPPDRPMQGVPLRPARQAAARRYAVLNGDGLEHVPGEPLLVLEGVEATVQSSDEPWHYYMPLEGDYVLSADPLPPLSRAQITDLHGVLTEFLRGMQTNVGYRGVLARARELAGHLASLGFQSAAAPLETADKGPTLGAASGTGGTS